MDALDTTYLAWWVDHQRPVLVKRVHEHLLGDDAFTRRLRERAGRAIDLVHPNVVRTLAMVDAPDDLAIVTDYEPSASLAEVQDAVPTGALPPPIAVAIVVSVLRGLAAAHDAPAGNGDGLLHRRLSREDVLLAEDGVVRVCGFEALAIAPLADELNVRTRLRYVSPEELVEGQVDRRSDTYAAAVLLWEALTGESLFGDLSIEGVVRNVLAAPVPPPSAFGPGISPALDAIVLRGLQRDASARFARAADMATELEREAPHASRSELRALLPTLDLPALAGRRATARIIAARERAAC